MIDLLAEQEERKWTLAAPSSFPSREIGRLKGEMHIAPAGGSTTRITFSASACESKPRIGPLRYYSPETGRWLSRDPINDIGFRTGKGIRSQQPRMREERNLLAFISNDPVDFVDILGLAKADGYQCCDQETLAKGEEKLKERYGKAKKSMEAKGRPHRGKKENSCYNVNGDILGDIAPIPKCWTCDLEHRTRGSGYIWSPRSDHWVIVCIAREKNGRKLKDILFDYWADRPAGEDPDDWFRNRYPDLDPDDQEDFSTAHDTCDGRTYK